MKLLAHYAKIKNEPETIKSAMRRAVKNWIKTKNTTYFCLQILNHIFSTVAEGIGYV